jgi:hypothetical protein
MNTIIPNTRKVAFVIDGQVVEIITTEDRLASILLSNPITIDVTGQTVDEGGEVEMGVTYNYSTKKLFKITQVEIPSGTQSEIFQPVTDVFIEPQGFNEFPVVNNLPMPIVNNPSPCGCNKQNG